MQCLPVPHGRASLPTPRFVRSLQPPYLLQIAVCKASSNSKQQQQADVERLEQLSRKQAVPSPEPVTDHNKNSSAQQAQQNSASLLPVPGQQQLWPANQDSMRAKLRGTYIRQVLPFFRAVRKTEQKLEADLPAVGLAVVFMVAIILYDRGWNNIMDLIDQSVLGDICCIMVGLGMVIGVKLMGWQPKDYWRI